MAPFAAVVPTTIVGFAAGQGHRLEGPIEFERRLHVGLFPCELACFFLCLSRLRIAIHANEFTAWAYNKPMVNARRQEVVEDLATESLRRSGKLRFRPQGSSMLPTIRSGRSSLRLDFDGTQNVDFHHVAQHVSSPPGRYRLSAWIRTADLSTDQGVALAFHGVSTAALNGTHDWTEVHADITVAASTPPGDIQVVRQHSLRFDSKPHGTVWIDDVTLRKINP